MTTPNQPGLGACLDEAKAVINGPRQDAYGSPADNFAAIAGLWSAYLNQGLECTSPDFVPIYPRDVAHMLALMKIAREGHTHKRDNLVDACGYLAIAADGLGQED
jgi:hypothetical protein